jgi:hypothetical protein
LTINDEKSRSGTIRRKSGSLLKVDDSAVGWPLAEKTAIG